MKREVEDRSIWHATDRRDTSKTLLYSRQLKEEDIGYLSFFVKNFNFYKKDFEVHFK